MRIPKSFMPLPSDYVFLLEIDILKNKGVALWIGFLQIFLLFFFLFFLLVMRIELHFEIWTTIALIPSLIFIVVVHEWIHGLFFKMGTDQKIKYAFHGFAASASVPGVYFTKKHYLLVGIAPALFLNLLLALLCFIPSQEWRSFFFVLLAIHFSSCSGDFFVFIRFLFLNPNVLIEDTGIGMKVFIKNALPDVNSTHI